VTRRYFRKTGRQSLERLIDLYLADVAGFFDNALDRL